MVDNNDFYVFKVLEKHEDKLLFNEDGNFYKGDRFIGWEWKGLKKAVKDSSKELVCIPIDKVKKLYKIRFEEVEEI